MSECKSVKYCLNIYLHRAHALAQARASPLSIPRFPPLYRGIFVRSHNSHPHIITARMDDGEGRTTRSAKRRKISVPPISPLSRTSSPDELAADSDHSLPNPQRRSSISHITVASVSHRPSYSPMTQAAEDSPDELDHTTEHSFYREPFRGSFSAESRRQIQHLRVPSRSHSPPPYSRISTPIATPPPIEAKEAKYVPYKLKMALKGHRRGVAAVRFSPNGKMIASCCE